MFTMIIAAIFAGYFIVITFVISPNLSTGPKQLPRFISAPVSAANGSSVLLVNNQSIHFNWFLCDNQNNLVGLIKPGDRLVVQPLVQPIFGTHYDCLMAIRQPPAHQVGN